jgi:hypothetical protein
LARQGNNEERSTIAAIPTNSIHTNTNTIDLADCFWKDKHPLYPIGTAFTPRHYCCRYSRCRRGCRRS